MQEEPKYKMILQKCWSYSTDTHFPPEINVNLVVYICYFTFEICARVPRRRNTRERSNKGHTFVK